MTHNLAILAIGIGLGVLWPLILLGALWCVTLVMMGMSWLANLLARGGR